MKTIVISITVHEGVPEDMEAAQSLCRRWSNTLPTWLGADVGVFSDSTGTWSGMPPQVYAGVQSNAD